MPYPSEHACRLNNPGKYVRIRRRNNYAQVDGKQVDYIFGIRRDGKTETQAMRFPVSAWTASAARRY